LKASHHWIAAFLESNKCGDTKTAPPIILFLKTRLQGQNLVFLALDIQTGDKEIIRFTRFIKIISL